MRMSKASYLIKNLGTIIVPALLFSLLVFQLHRCRSILALRNSYLLETLPSPVEWIWDALSGLHNEYIFGDQRLEEKQADAVVENAVSQSDHRHSTLLPNVPSLTVHYLWCIDAHFEMSHYILILSVIHQLRPDKIIIHYRTRPRPDPQGYWHWLEDLQRNVIMLSLRPLKNAKYCSHDLSAGVSQDDYDFTDPFGVFILGDIAVTNLSRLDVVASMLLSFSSKDFSSLHIVSEEEELLKSQLFLVPANEPFHISQSPGRVVLSCPTSAIVDKMKTVSNVTCVTMDTNINFDFLLRANSTFYRFARSMIYGSPNLVQIRMSSHIQIPNIVHIILVDGIGEITPLLYASIKSAYIKGQVDYVYVHGPKPPKGKLWDMLHTQDELKVHYIPIAAEKLMFKNSAMNYGLFILLQYGGMMHFGDVIFMSPIPEDIMHSPAIATLHYSQYRLRHRSTNTAFLASTKGSKFIESILVTLSQSEISWPEARADDVATHVGELYPDSVLLEAKLISHLQCTQTCQVSGGHTFPAYTVRMIWSDNPPSTLDELKHTEGPAKNDVKQIIETVHLIHNKIL